jgi:hypothetical protein
MLRRNEYKLKNIDKDLIRIYIRHTNERTVSILRWYFDGYKQTLLSGINRRFSILLEENFELMLKQEEPYAIVVDGDIVPIMEKDELITMLITPFFIDDSLITVNGTRVDKFLYYPMGKTGGFKSYNVKHILKYLKNLNKDSLRPESELYKVVGGMYQISPNIIQCGHEYGQYLWHIYNKAIQRGIKSNKKIILRKLNSIEFEIHKKGLLKGLLNKKELFNYTPELLPKEFRSFEMSSIKEENIKNEYIKLKNEIQKDVIKKWKFIKLINLKLKMFFNKGNIIEI